MVLRDKHRAAEPPCPAMASDQPVKKKQRIDGPDLGEEDDKYGSSPDSGALSEDADYAPPRRGLQERLVQQCLCGAADELLRPLAPRGLALWPPEQLLHYLSNVQLLFDVYLKQNYKGSICPVLMDVCDALVRNKHDWLYCVIALADHPSRFVMYLASRVVASFLIVAKDNIDPNWLNKIIENVYLFDTINTITVRKINFSLDVIKHVVEWKDIDQHPLEDSAYINTSNPMAPPSDNHASVSSTLFHDAASTSRENISRESNLQSAFSNLHTTPSSSSFSSSLDSSVSSECNIPAQPGSMIAPSNFSISNNSLHSSFPAVPETSNSCNNCPTVSITDSESFDTTHIKCLTIKCLESHWPTLVINIKKLLERFLDITNSENCILTFLSLWENIISVKANLSVVDTKPFYMDLQSFVELLLQTSLPSLIYSQLLSLFNEVLCYGSTLALQDILPEETCTLAHSVVRFVKDNRLLDNVQLGHNRTGFGFVGYDGLLRTSYSLNSHFVEFGTQPTGSLVDPSYGHDELTLHSSHSRLNPRTLRSLTSNETDKAMLQKMVLLVLKSVAVTVKEMRCDSSDSSIDSSDYNAIQDMQMVERSIRDVLKKLDDFLKTALDFLPNSPFTKILIHLFSEQDNYLIESMVCTLDITVGIVYGNSVFPDLLTMLNPTLTFIEFLEVVSHDPDVLLDFLVSNETCFLLYLLRFLKYVRRNWHMFVACQCEQDSTVTRVLDKTMTVLVRLRFQIKRLVSRSLFPYDINPVLRRLEWCELRYESRYEGDELS